MAGQQVVSRSRRQRARADAREPTDDEIGRLRPHARHGTAGRIPVRCGKCEAVLVSVDLRAVLNRTLDRPIGLPRLAPEPGIGLTGWTWRCSCGATPPVNLTRLWEKYRDALEAGTDIYVGGGRPR